MADNGRPSEKLFRLYERWAEGGEAGVGNGQCDGVESGQGFAT